MVNGQLTKCDGHRVDWAVVATLKKAQCQGLGSLPKVLPTEKFECSYGSKC
jgi:hypothetical protein